MEKFNVNKEDLERLAYESYRSGVFIGSDAALQALEKFLDLEEIPDPLPKELLRSQINESRKRIEVDKQKLLDYEEDKDEDEDKVKDKEKDN